MYAVNALYDGVGNVKIDPANILINAPYKVIVTFVEPAQEHGTSTEGSPLDEANAASGVAKKLAALAKLEKFGKRLPADFDYKKERDAYYEERHEKYMRSH
jgi:hypothetical protein